MSRLKNIPLYWQILAALALAVLAGVLTESDSFLHAGYSFIGTLFLNALKMVVIPLVVASVICSISGISGANFGRLGGKTLGYYLVTSTLAILIGLLCVNLLEPGKAGDEQVQLLGADVDAAQVQRVLEEKVSNRGGGDIVGVFLRMVPPNVIAAAADGQLLGLIFFSLLFGFFMSRSSGSASGLLHEFWEKVLDVMMRMTMWIMMFAPLGVFGLVADTVTETGFAAFRPLLWFFISVVLALSLQVLVVYPLLLALVGRVSPLRQFQAMSPALLTAFSTASSSGTLPVTMECVRVRAGVSERTSGFVLPLGATVNMDGTALYECAAVLFIAQVYGVDLSFAQQFLIVLTALLTSIGVAGIPAASLVAITIVLGAVGLPLEGIGLLFITDRILDMMRTAVNVFGDSCGATVIARSEGEHRVLEEPPEIAQARQQEF